MTRNEALDVVTNACARMMGTQQEHYTIQIALQVLKEESTNVTNGQVLSSSNESEQ